MDFNLTVSEAHLATALVKFLILWSKKGVVSRADIEKLLLWQPSNWKFVNVILCWTPEILKRPKYGEGR